MAEHHPEEILVTGGAGFIGSHLIRQLLTSSPDVRIINLDALTYAGDLARLDDMAGHPRLEHVVGDICDRRLVDSLLARPGVNSIMHLAAESHVDRSISGPAAFIQTNVVGTFTLLEAARTAWFGDDGPRSDVRFHHVSTDEVYGQLGPNDPPFSEASPYAPSSPYSASKAGSDHLVRAYHHTYGLPAVTTNCSNNYGPHQDDEKFIPTVIRSCLEGTQIPVYGDGSNVRDWLYVRDHCEALEVVLRRGRVGATYVIGGDNEQSNLKVVYLICRIMDDLRPASAPHDRLVTFVTDRPGHDWRYAIDASLIAEELGWEPSVSFEAGLRRTVDRALAQTQGAEVT